MIGIPFVLVRQFHHHPAGHDRLEEGLQFVGFFADMRFQRVGMLKAAKCDLQGRFHLVFLSFRLFKDRSVTMGISRPLLPATTLSV
jgi:hypothetical protein